MVKKGKDADSSIGEFFKNRKRYHSSKDRDGRPSVKTSRTLSNHIDDDLRLQEPEGSCINKMADEKIEHTYFATSAENARL